MGPPSGPTLPSLGRARARSLLPHVQLPPRTAPVTRTIDEAKSHEPRRSLTRPPEDVKFYEPRGPLAWPIDNVKAHEPHRPPAQTTDKGIRQPEVTGEGAVVPGPHNDKLGAPKFTQHIDTTSQSRSRISSESNHSAFSPPATEASSVSIHDESEVYGAPSDIEDDPSRLSFSPTCRLV